jgi:hypothetical protein
MHADPKNAGTIDLPRGGAIDPDFINLRGIIPHVFHMPEDMSPPVLAHKVAQVRPEAHVRDGGLVVPPARDGEVLEEEEALAVEELGADGVQEGGEVGEGEVRLFFGRVNVSV